MIRITQYSAFTNKVFVAFITIITVHPMHKRALALITDMPMYTCIITFVNIIVTHVHTNKFIIETDDRAI